LSDIDIIDVLTPIPPDSLLIVVMDLYPWPDSNSDERFEQFQRKLESYCRYVVSEEFLNDHPGVDRSKLVISVVAIVPPSKRMRQTRAVYTPSDPSYEILVRFADEGNGPPVGGAQPVKKPWWRFWG